MAHRIDVIHPFQGCTVIWDFADHVAHGRIGGTDYKVKPARGFPVRAAAAGVVTRINAHEARLTVTPSFRINYRELGSFQTGEVVAGQVFASSGLLMPGGRSYYGVHIDAEVKRNGRWIREAFEPHVNAKLAPAGDSTIPLVPDETPKPPERPKTMTTNYVRTSSGDKKGGEGSLWATAGDAGFAGPGNWLEFTRTPADGSTNDRGRRMADVHGNAIYLTDAEWDAHKKAYTTPGAAGTLVIDDATIAKLATANAKAFFVEQKAAGN